MGSDEYYEKAGNCDDEKAAALFYIAAELARIGDKLNKPTLGPY